MPKEVGSPYSQHNRQGFSFPKSRRTNTSVVGTWDVQSRQPTPISNVLFGLLYTQTKSRDHKKLRALANHPNIVPMGNRDPILWLMGPQVSCKVKVDHFHGLQHLYKFGFPHNTIISVGVSGAVIICSWPLVLH
jgi:hypothetical protein